MTLNVGNIKHAASIKGTALLVCKSAIIVLRSLVAALVLSLLGALALDAVSTPAQSQPRMRYHDAIRAQRLVLAPVNSPPPAPSRARWSQGGTRFVLKANGLPSHAIGAFPNRGNPNAVRAQDLQLQIPARPRMTGSATPLRLGFRFGVSLEGVVFDPMAAEFWHGNPRSGWQYNALGGAIRLGLDANYAHVQPNGAYHYHGLPSGLLQGLSWSPQAHSPLVGYAADGFPIYALTGVQEGQVVRMTSSYRLKVGQRPGGSQPSGAYDGAFLQDYQYQAGLGTLDACNGAFTGSKEFPQGSYAYFLTEAFPVIPLCFAGTPDNSFALPRPGRGLGGPNRGGPNLGGPSGRSGPGRPPLPPPGLGG